MSSNQEKHSKSDTCLEIQCVHCGGTMFVFLNYAMERMGAWDLEEIEDTIAEVDIGDRKRVKVDDGTGMDVDGVDKSGGDVDEGYTVNISHQSGDRPCGKDTLLTNKQFHQIVLAAKKTHRV